MNRKNELGFLLNILLLRAGQPMNALLARLPSLTRRRQTKLAFVDKITVIQPRLKYHSCLNKFMKFLCQRVCSIFVLKIAFF
jgi:hypothetical protein